MKKVLGFIFAISLVGMPGLFAGKDPVQNALDAAGKAFKDASKVKEIQSIKAVTDTGTKGFAAVKAYAVKLLQDVIDTNANALTDDNFVTPLVTAATNAAKDKAVTDNATSTEASHKKSAAEHVHSKVRAVKAIEGFEDDFTAVVNAAWEAVGKYGEAGKAQASADAVVDAVTKAANQVKAKNHVAIALGKDIDGINALTSTENDPVKAKDEAIKEIQKLLKVYSATVGETIAEWRAWISTGANNNWASYKGYVLQKTGYEEGSTKGKAAVYGIAAAAGLAATGALVGLGAIINSFREGHKIRNWMHRMGMSVNQNQINFYTVQLQQAYSRSKEDYDAARGLIIENLGQSNMAKIDESFTRAMQMSK